MVANANMMIAFLIHLHIVIMSDVINVRKTMNSRKTSVLLNNFRNIWKGIYILRIGIKKLEKGCKKLLKEILNFLKYQLKIL